MRNGQSGCLVPIELHEIKLQQLNYDVQMFNVNISLQTPSLCSYVQYHRALLAICSLMAFTSDGAGGVLSWKQMTQFMQCSDCLLEIRWILVTIVDAYNPLKPERLIVLILSGFLFCIVDR